MPKSVVPSRIFLSHSQSDEVFACELARELGQRGASVWLDRETIALGDELRARIRDAIKSSDLILILLSPTSARSAWVRKELELALAFSQRTRVVPIRLGRAELPDDLGDVRGLLYLDAETRNVAAVADQVFGPSPDPTISARGSVTLERQVEELLLAEGLSFERQPSLAGVRPDLLAETPDGRRLVIEVKSTSTPTLIDAVDALTEANHLRELTGADDAVVVFANATISLPTTGVVTLAQLETYLGELVATRRRPRVDPLSRPSSDAAAQERTVFASMPFSPQYEDVYWVAMTAAAEAVGATCVRVDREDFDGDIPSKIKQLIESSVAMIADLSESNPDVLYEVEYARRHGCPCVHITSTPPEELPFNVRNLSTLSYVSGRTHALRAPLIERLKAVVRDPRA